MNLVQREGKVKSVPVSHLPLREDILYLNCLCALFLNDLVTNNGFHSICNYNIAVIIKFLRNVDVLTILNSSSFLISAGTAINPPLLTSKPTFSA